MFQGGLNRSLSVLTRRLEAEAKLLPGKIMVAKWNREGSNWTQGQKKKNLTR